MRKEIYRPPHLYLDNTIYFITASTVPVTSERRLKCATPDMDGVAHFSVRPSERRLKSATPIEGGVANFSSRSRFIMDDDKLAIFASLLKETVKSYDFELVAWVVLKNHYHLLMKIIKGRHLPEFIKKLHGKSAFQFNKTDKVIDRKIWYQYWDTCIEDEKDMYMRLNYIHNNPIKHRYVKDIMDYEYSSYSLYLKRFGKEWIDDVWQNYPVIDYLEGDDFDGVAHFSVRPSERRLKPATPNTRRIT